VTLRSPIIRSDALAEPAKLDQSADCDEIANQLGQPATRSEPTTPVAHPEGHGPRPRLKPPRSPEGPTLRTCGTSRHDLMQWAA
jgi:hypothetical protein